MLRALDRRRAGRNRTGGVLMATRTTFKAKSGSDTSGEISLPEGAGKAPAVVLAQEWWGINDHIRSLLDRLAKAGFVALAPDLYHGKTAKDAGEAGKMMQALDWKGAMDEIAGAAVSLTKHERGNGKVGMIGFCMGGALTFAAATQVPELAAAAPFYGIPGPETDYKKVRAPIQAHFAKRDDWAKASTAEEIKKVIEQNGGSMELFVYDADHAFVNDTRPEVYSADNAKQAWDRAMAFLHEHLG
jgi:carboxymethylenebutenolidase